MCDGFDIFRKLPDGRLAWLACAASLDAATQHIALIAANVPGEYVVFCQATQQVVSVTAPSVSKAKGEP
jgi:hypothetical protein